MQHDDDFIDEEPEPRFSVAIFGYCGMSIPIEQNTDLESARLAAAKCIRRRRQQKLAVVRRKRGERWEILCPEDAVMVPDVCGELAIFAGRGEGRFW